ncbi:hypothetical protein Q7404_10295 [Glaesserella parasuis]|nr:hypothetical protein [Glaesserella parasuis]
MKIKQKLLVLAGALSLSSVSMAAADYSQIGAGLSFESAVTAIIAVAVALAGLYGAVAGARGVLRMIK